MSLKRGDYDDGLADGSTTFRSVQRRFSPWMVGHAVEIISGPSAGIYVINSYNNPGSVVLAGTVAVETDVEWRLIPQFATVIGRTAQFPRATFVGDVITTPVPMPVTVLVDYTHDPSAQALLSPAVDGNDQYPFYLWDEGFLIQTLLDLVRAAGVRIVLVPE